MRLDRIPRFATSARLPTAYPSTNGNRPLERSNERHAHARRDEPREGHVDSDRLSELMRRISGARAADGPDGDVEQLANGGRIVRRLGGRWAPTTVEGVRVKVLHEDAEADQRTALYQMDPGTCYPAHVHGGSEECYVLSGDLQVEDLEMRRGDFQRVSGGSHHVPQSTIGGCVLFITCSMSDELD